MSKVYQFHNFYDFSYKEWEAEHIEPAISSNDLLPTTSVSDRHRNTLSFLDLAPSVRAKIYELAVYDHDRTAVFLPRAVPRKVEPGIDDVDVELVDAYAPSVVDAWAQQDLHRAASPAVSAPDRDNNLDEDWDLPENPPFGPYFLDPLSRHWIKLLRPTGPAGSAASGTFVDEEENVAALTFSELRCVPQAVARLNDMQLLALLEQIDQSEAFTDLEHIGTGEQIVVVEPEKHEKPAAKVQARVSEPRRLVYASDEESLDTDPECSCCASSPDSNSNYGDLAGGEGDVEVKIEAELDTLHVSANGHTNSNASIGLAAADAPNEGDGGGGGVPGHVDTNADIDPTDQESLDDWVDESRNVFTMDEHDDADDIEHYDMEELVGILYEPKEPSILLASKEVRKECLPMYYSRNAFSWRFLSTHYERSCQRFKAWIRSIQNEHITLITRITFQGRHMVEEGLEYSADIDLTETFPYFETRVYTDDTQLHISQSINRQLAELCWLMTNDGNTRPLFTASLLLKLASTFVQGMHQDAGGGLAEGAAECREILSPIFPLQI